MFGPCRPAPRNSSRTMALQRVFVRISGARPPVPPDQVWALKSSSKAAILAGSDWSMMARARVTAAPSSSARTRCLTRGKPDRRHRQLADAQPDQQRREARVAGDLPAQADRDAVAQRRLGRELDQPQHRRVQRIEQMRHLLVAAVDRERVHRQVVGPDGEEVADLREGVGRKCRARHLDHGADRRQRVGDRRAAAHQPPRDARRARRGLR